MLLTLALACTGPLDDTGAGAAVEVVDVAVVAPSPGLPPEVVVQDSANNLDIEWHDGRLFFAFRTAPSHFASTDTVMYIVSSQDEQTWRYEGEFALGTDVREPQLVSYEGTLHFYFAVLGDNLLDFEPQGMQHAVYNGPGDWSEPVANYVDKFIPWRIEVEHGVMRMVGYDGGENVYDFNDYEPLRIHWMQSTDGEAWTPVAGDGILAEGGGSETDYAFLPDGSLVGITRVEAFDPGGMGSRVCTAPADDLGTWDCAHDPRKYDSPLVFSHRGRPWLVGRRNVTDDGAYDISTHEDPEQHYLENQFAYWNERKRCSVWSIDPNTRSVAFELDLPSQGDTCFPEVVPANPDDPDGDLILYNYSNPVDGPDLHWQAGQTDVTVIYRQVLRLPG